MTVADILNDAVSESEEGSLSDHEIEPASSVRKMIN